MGISSCHFTWNIDRVRAAISVPSGDYGATRTRTSPISDVAEALFDIAYWFCKHARVLGWAGPRPTPEPV
jgi:hypothetical protein